MQVFWDLKAGDLSIVGSSLFADYNHQLMPNEEFQRKVGDYCRMLGFPAEGSSFAGHVRIWLEEEAHSTDRTFPANKSLRIERGEPMLTPVAAIPDPESLAELEALIAARQKPVSVLHALATTAQWLGWDRFFGPLSGHDAKIDEPRPRYVSTVFGYGCHLTPAELARAVDGLDRRQVIYINLRHISEDGLDNIISDVVSRYHLFALPHYWGSARRVGADGTHWALYENNLHSERHVRYGDYGGIAYYHVTGTYIARFSHFISCGALEGSYILDPFFAPENKDEELPEALHSDTHGQSTTIFGLAFLLGIQLYPRIRGWKHLIWCRPSPDSHYEHIDELFAETVDWQVLVTHLPDMLRVALSIREGLLTPSTILRRLGTYSRKNRLYHAFFELGRVIRTGFLLRYIADPALQATIQAAMNKNESFNRFVQGVTFGDDGTITENDRLEQRKSMKYTHVVANCLIFLYHGGTQSHSRPTA
jgi:TnpA family transposase